MNPDYAAVLTHHPDYVGSQWSLSGDAYDGLTWLSDTPKPTKKQLDDRWPAVEQQLAEKAIDDARHARYVVETDPIFFRAWANANPGGQPDLTEWRAARKKIQDDLPKPTR
jgi:hypothetical protein